MNTALNLAAVAALVVGVFAALPYIIALVGVAPFWIRHRSASALPSFWRLLYLGKTVAPRGSAFEAVVAAESAGLKLDPDWAVGHSNRGGDPARVVVALITARGRGDEVDISRLVALDLGGYDPVKAAELGNYHPDIPEGPLRDTLRKAGFPGLGAA